MFRLRMTAPRCAVVAALAFAASLVVPASGIAGEDDRGNGKQNQRPTACITQSPQNPQSGQTVTFDSSCSRDSDGQITARAWDLDNDGEYDDGTGTTATRAWATPGRYTIRLGVVDDDGAVGTVTRTVTIANRGPVAAFTFDPAEPVAGQTVTLTSISTDPDGTVASHAWDLDNDGKFDDATGVSVSFTPPAAGTYPVALRVVDDRRASASVSKTFTVREAASPAPAPPPPTTPAQPFDDSMTTSPEPPAALGSLRWLDPFPIVRIRGRTDRRGVVLSLFTVRAPAGARIELRCAGKGCPRRVTRRLVRTRAGKPAATVRFRSLEGRLSSGARVQVKITRKGVVGKYTSFRIRRLKVPVRTDACLMPESGRPVECPTTAP